MKQAKYLRAEQALLDEQGVSAESRMVDLARLGGQLRVLIAGEGPPIVFLSGVMNSGAVFAHLVGRLPDYRCIMIDRPGTGLSPQLDPPPRSLDAQKRVADLLVVDVLDALDVERSHIVSTSMGGWTAFRSLAAHPDRFDRAVAYAYQVGARVTGVPKGMSGPTPPDWMIPKRVWATRRLVRASFKQVGAANALERGTMNDVFLDWAAALMRHTPTFGNDSRYCPRPVDRGEPVEEVRHSAELLARVTAPVHLFWGTDDVFGNADSAREFAAMLPNATLQLVEGANHAPWFDELEMAVDAVRTHFASTTHEVV